jgi:Glycine zipper 2TM domain
MNRLILLCQITLVALFFASASYASGGDRGRGHGEHHRHHGGRYNQQGNYYGPPPQNYQDPRSHQGLAGGVVGSVLGYEMGNGNPVATGLGAAAGSFIGNGMSGRR